MHLPELLDTFEPETDPERRHWQVYLAAAWAAFPSATVPVLVEQAIAFAGRGADADRHLIEEIALGMLLARPGDPA